MRRYANGFTMVELMITLVVVAILAGLALPAFDGAFERSRASTEVNDLAKALSYGRLEAINRSQPVEVVPTDPDEALREIDGALQRIQTGCYGRCESTGASIPEARLRARPWCRTAIDAPPARAKKNGSNGHSGHQPALRR